MHISIYLFFFSYTENTRFLLLFFPHLSILFFYDYIFCCKRFDFMDDWRTVFQFCFFYKPVILLTWFDEPIFQFCLYMPLMSQNLFYMIVIFWFYDLFIAKVLIFMACLDLTSIFSNFLEILLSFICVLYSCLSVLLGLPFKV